LPVVNFTTVLLVLALAELDAAKLKNLEFVAVTVDKAFRQVQIDKVHTHLSAPRHFNLVDSFCGRHVLHGSRPSVQIYTIYAHWRAYCARPPVSSGCERIRRPWRRSKPLATQTRPERRHRVGFAQCANFTLGRLTGLSELRSNSGYYADDMLREWSRPCPKTERRRRANVNQRRPPKCRQSRVRYNIMNNLSEFSFSS
jgi:hypothetical protein